jgi:hypothetical protein
MAAVVLRDRNHGGHGPYMDAPGLPSNQFVLV